jgi:branched-chain amino acid transport system permease protein
VQTISSNLVNEYIRYVSVIAAAFIALLVMPSGISDFFEQRRIRRMSR